MQASTHSAGLRVHAFGVEHNPRYFLPLQHLANTGRVAAFALHAVAPPTTSNDAKVVDAGWARLRHGLGALGSGDVAVLGLAPYDPRVDGLLPALRTARAAGARVLLRTSWPSWDDDFQPYPATSTGTRQAWAALLAEVQAVCVNQPALAALRGRCRGVVQIPHAVDRSVFATDGAAPGASTPFAWITVARLVPGKGLRALVDLFAARREQGARLTIVGDGPLGAELRARAAGAPVELCPYPGDALPELLRQHQGFVLNSHRCGRWEELFGIALIEAMACGLPVVATDCVGPREFVVDGETGLRVAQRDGAGLLRALRRLEADPALRARLRTAGLELVRRRYDLERVAAQWLAALDGSAFAAP